jgi:anaerobic magnesium-protoporphyrin IX monomethyl ester cyclase
MAESSSTEYNATMRVLLVRPPRRDSRDPGLCVPPLGLAYIAASLRSAGHQVSILDAYAARWTWDRFVQDVADFGADVLGLTAMTPTADVVAKAVRLCRPHVRWTVVGGPHPTAVRQEIFQGMPGLDAAVVGEGEEVAVELLRWFGEGSEGEPPAGVLVQGASFRPAEPPSIGSIPWPARDLLPNASYRYLFSTRRGFGTMITSRGCPFRCSFCDKSVSGSRWRARSPIEIVDEMEDMHLRFGIGFINFYDDNFTLQRSRVEGICEELLRRRLKVEWKCEGRVDGVDTALLRLMRSAGCRVVAYGVESGKRETLAMLRKDITVEETIAAFAATREAGLRSLAYLILGSPGESAEDVLHTLRFCREIGADYAQFSTLDAMPGTPLYLERQGGPSVKSPLDSDRSRRTLTDLPSEELERLLRKAWMGFYLRPRVMGRISLDAWRSGSVDEGFRMATALGRWALRA